MRFLKSRYLAFAAGVFWATSASAQSPGDILGAGVDIYNVYDKVVFYDGYKTDAVVDADKADGTLRFTNYHYSRKLDMSQLREIDNLNLEVLVGAMCDNYDRMGRIILAFPSAGSETYDPAATERIEIARFITPFMNKNKQPDVVPYLYDVRDLGEVLADETVTEGRDVWMEVELFGIPYAANEEIEGCAGRNDVFNVTASFGRGAEPGDARHEAPKGMRLLPVTLAKCEIHGNVNLNNYKPEATDTLGTTTRTYTIDVPVDLSDSYLTLILTNHGAGDEGEEYVRRKHLVYIDGEIALVYTPGGVSCEPYRKYNTQPNGIYSMMRPPAFWKTFSNWCPGQAVPTRHIPVGTLKAGAHKLMIRVPEAEFYGGDGDFRPSAWLAGAEEGAFNSYSAVEEFAVQEEKILSLRGTDVLVAAPERVRCLTVYSYDGRLLEGCYRPGSTFSMEAYPAGQYIVVAETEEGRMDFVKVIR